MVPQAAAQVEAERSSLLPGVHGPRSGELVQPARRQTSGHKRCTTVWYARPVLARRGVGGLTQTAAMSAKLPEARHAQMASRVATGSWSRASQNPESDGHRSRRAELAITELTWPPGLHQMATSLALARSARARALASGTM